MTSIFTTEDYSRKQFYEQAADHLKSLNIKFREKAVITQTMNDKIVRCLSSKSPQEFDSRFLSWCRVSFVLQHIGLKYLLCDAKTNKPLLLYEAMYDVYKSTHLEAAHAGRDKCLDSLAMNYSWYNRHLLQIFIKNCSSCQKRKPLLKPMLSKPIIALVSEDLHTHSETSLHPAEELNNDIQETIFTLTSTKPTTSIDSRHELSRNIARVNYLKSQNKRQKTYDNHIQKIADSYKNGDLVGISINKVDRTNCDPKIMPCIIEKRSNNTDIPSYHLISPFGRISTSFPVHQLIPMSGIKPTVLQNIKFETVPTISLVQASKLLARGNPIATCDCKTKCLTKTCPCRRALVACSTKCHAKLGKCTNNEE